MTFIVNDRCIDCKFTDCVEVCPVDAFYEGPNMVVIDPDKCIDCAVCVPECPAEAILPDTDDAAFTPFDWVAFNTKYAGQWKKIVRKKEALPNARELIELPNKLERFKE
jgi:ferredoxin